MNVMYDIEVKTVLLAWMFLGLHRVNATSESKEFCQRDKINITCPGDDVIMIQKAKYGRMRRNIKCVPTPLSVYDGCQIGVVSFMDSRCSGRQSCQFSLLDEEIDTNYEPINGANGCPSDIPSYLAVEYKCIKVVPTPHLRCRQDKELEVPYTDGYLSTAIARKTGLGTKTCPWKLQVKTGQRINITILNFNRTKFMSSGSSGCYTYGQIKEEGTNPIQLNICNKDPRSKLVYSSTSSQLTVELYKRRSSVNTETLIQFQASGCEDISLQAAHQIKREGDKAEITCIKDGSSEIYHLTCKGKEWLGQKNCSSAGSNTDSDKIFISTSTGFPYGLVIVVAIGVALGIFLGGVLLLCASLYMKRKNQSNGDYARPDYDIEYNLPGGENCAYPHIIHTPTCAPHQGNVDTTLNRCAKHGIPPGDMLANTDHNTMVLGGQLHNIPPYKTTERTHIPKFRDHLYEHPKQ